LSDTGSVVVISTTAVSLFKLAWFLENHGESME